MQVDRDLREVQWFDRIVLSLLVGIEVDSLAALAKGLLVGN